MKDTQKKKVLLVTGMDAIPMIMEGIESSASGHVVSEDGLTRIAEALEAGDAATAMVTQLQSQLEAVNTERTNAVEQLAAANNTIATQAASIGTLTARVAELEEEAPITQTTREKDKTGMAAAASYKDPNNVFNQIADSLFGPPKEKEAV